jgi:hypothetical protein
LRAYPECANQTLDFNKTPLHLIVEVINDTNLPTVFEIIKIFSEFDGNFTWPARQSGNQTPFSMLLEKLGTLKDKATCLQIIRYLIGKYPKIDMFQRKECAAMIRKNFEELVGEYKPIESWKEETNMDMDIDLKSELKELIEENEAEFLVKFDAEKKKG